jgi:hypothetical protein
MSRGQEQRRHAVSTNVSRWPFLRWIFLGSPYIQTVFHHALLVLPPFLMYRKFSEKVKRNLCTHNNIGSHKVTSFFKQNFAKFFSEIPLNFTKLLVQSVVKYFCKISRNYITKFHMLLKEISRNILAKFHEISRN